MALHFTHLGAGLNSQKTIDLLIKSSVGEEVHEAIQNFGETFDQLIEEEKYSDLILETLQIIQSSQADRAQLSQIYSAVGFWLTQYPEHLKAFYGHIDQIEDKVYVTKIYVRLFNTFNGSPNSINVFRHLWAVSKAANTTGLFMPSILQDIGAFLTQWKLNAKDETTLLLDILEGIQQESQIHSLTKYILLKAGNEDIDTVFVKFINANPNYLTLIEVTDKLKNNKSTIVQLIQLVRSGDLTQIHAFIQKNQDILTRLSLNTQIILDQARTSKLLKATQRVFSYAQISEQLQIPVAEVETWIIKSIQSENIQAQIDQSKQEIIITDNSNRVLNIDDWKSIQQRLIVLQQALKA